MSVRTNHYGFCLCVSEHYLSDQPCIGNEGIDASAHSHELYLCVSGGGLSDQVCMNSVGSDTSSKLHVMRLYVAYVAFLNSSVFTVWSCIILYAFMHCVNGGCPFDQLCSYSDGMNNFMPLCTISKCICMLCL